LRTEAKSGASRSVSAIVRLICASTGASVPSTPARIRRDTTPSRSWSTSTCCTGEGERGRKAEKSVLNSVRLTMAAQNSTNVSHAATSQRERMNKLTE
jgi:hypothetical protein